MFHHHHQPINVTTAGVQAFLMNYKGEFIRKVCAPAEGPFLSFAKINKQGGHKFGKIIREFFDSICTVNSTSNYTVWTLYSSYFKGVSANIELHVDRTYGQHHLDMLWRSDSVLYRLMCC
jgi:hypothetical protein